MRFFLPSVQNCLYENPAIRKRMKDSVAQLVGFFDRVCKQKAVGEVFCNKKSRYALVELWMLPN